MMLKSHSLFVIFSLCVASPSLHGTKLAEAFSMIGPSAKAAHHHHRHRSRSLSTAFPTSNRISTKGQTSLFFVEGDDEYENTLLTPNFTLPSNKDWMNVLDVNGDGTVDFQDLLFVLMKLLDVNRDGKIDQEDAKTGLSLVLVSWILMGAPANAKGGGHGGGGGGGGYYGTSSSHSYEPYRRPNRKYTNKNNNSYRPMACSNLPVQGELIDVLVNNRCGIYRPGIVTSVQESKCRFQTNVNSEYLSTNRNWMDWFVASLLMGGVSVVPLSQAYHRKLQEDWDDDFDRLFLLEDDAYDDRDATSNNMLLDPPKSGVYVGSTCEDDGSSQYVKTTLTFDDAGNDQGGTITGTGYDSMDGSYTVQGIWKANNGQVYWVEEYDTYEVSVRGWIDQKSDDGTTIDCRFVSSRRGIRGKFSLKLKRFPWSSWF